MFKHNRWFSVFLFCVLLVNCLRQLHGAPPKETEQTKSSKPIVYKRYVRRHPGNNEIDYVEEVFEEFYIRHKPPARQLSEDELDLLIRCDFDPSLAECKNLHKPKSTRPPAISKSTTTATTTTSSTTTTTTTATSSTTEDLPILPNVPTSDEAQYDTENANEYDDENENNYDKDNDIENEDYNDEEENEEAEEEVDANDYLNDI